MKMLFKVLVPLFAVLSLVNAWPGWLGGGPPPPPEGHFKEILENQKKILEDVESLLNAVKEGQMLEMTYDMWTRQQKMDKKLDTITTNAEALEEDNVVEVEEVIEEPTEEPMVDPIEEPAPEPEVDPTEEPLVDPTEEPLVDPIEEPVPEPEVDPTEEPLVDPIEEPVPEPEVDPTEESEVDPTEEPFVDPIEEPAPEPVMEEETAIDEPIEENLAIEQEDLAVESNSVPRVDRRQYSDMFNLK